MSGKEKTAALLFIIYLRLIRFRFISITSFDLG